MIRLQIECFLGHICTNNQAYSQHRLSYTMHGILCYLYLVWLWASPQGHHRHDPYVTSLVEPWPSPQPQPPVITVTTIMHILYMH